ncbi:MAG: long-chain fatty acid--CoA ligase [Bacteroidota bacterium]|nr:long-chain fatty acid--CoA ligase [Bacteroidota bacterium]
MPKFKIEKPDNLVDHFNIATEKFSDNKFLGTKNKDTGKYEWLTYREIRDKTDKFRGGLSSKGIKKGDSVGIIANNRFEWAVAAFATYGLSARFIPMYENETQRTWEYIIKDAGIKFLLISTEEIYEQLKHLLKETDSLENIYIIETEAENSMKALEEYGAKNPVEPQIPNSNEIAALIYTSGTTSDPKGVLLTHGNFISNARAGNNRYYMLNESSRSLSILPWAHSYGQVAELYNWLFAGGAIGFMENVETLAEDMIQIKPTFLIAVPRVFNKIYDGIQAKMNEAGGIKKKLFDMAVHAAEKNRIQNGNINLSTKIKLALGDKLVFSKIRAKFGGQLEASITASAKMNDDISVFFSDIGLPVYDCYGLSETSPALTMSSPKHHKRGSVGTALEMIDIRIDKSMTGNGQEDGEIQVMGPNLMVGYHNKEKQTSEVFTEDGWLKTGDRGRLDEEGFLFITGRIKEQYKIQNGKYVFPAAIEEDIRLLPYIENAMIYGEGRPHNVGIIVINCDILKKMAEMMKMKTKVDKLIHSPIVQEFISNEIQKSLKEKYGRYEIPKKFIYIKENFSIENGMLTQTFKLKRRNVLGKYLEQIENLYKSDK